MIMKKWFISTGFIPKKKFGFWHFLIGVHKTFRIAYVRPSAKPDYRRFYLGFVEIEWSSL